MTRLVDVSRPISAGMAVYPGDPAVELQPWTRIAAGAGFNVSRLSLSTHTGTHVDAPRHCFDGADGVDTLPLDVLCGPALVLDVAAPAGAIGRQALASVPHGCKRLLLRTGVADLVNLAPGPALTDAAARLLVERAVALVGIDRLSIAAADDPLPVHRLLLSSGVIILEGLDLTAAPAGPCTLLCLPLRLAAGDGAPARAVLVYA